MSEKKYYSYVSLNKYELKDGNTIYAGTLSGRVSQKGPETFTYGGDKKGARLNISVQNQVKAIKNMLSGLDLPETAVLYSENNGNEYASIGLTAFERVADRAMYLKGGDVINADVRCVAQTVNGKKYLNVTINNFKIERSSNGGGNKTATAAPAQTVADEPIVVETTPVVDDWSDDLPF